MCEHALKNFILLGVENLRNSVVKAGELVGAFFPFVFSLILSSCLSVCLSCFSFTSQLFLYSI